MKKSKLKRRLRKKYRFGEFQEFGFQFEVKFKPNLSETEADKILDEILDEIKAHKLSYGGGSSVEFLHGFVTAAKTYRSPTPAQRETLKNWLESRPGISSSQVGNLVDAWYDVD